MRCSAETFLSIENIPKLPKYIYYFIKCFFLFRKPLSVIYHYIGKSAPKDKVVELRSGLKIFLSDHPHDIITVFVILVKKDYGKVMRDSLVVDIGANIGVFSLYAAHMGARRVYAYEPNQKAFDVLSSNIVNNELEDVIVPYKLAVSVTDNEMVKIPRDPSPYNQVFAGSSNENCESVSTITLDRILSNNAIDFVDLLKIDCEGAEYEIIINLKSQNCLKLGSIRMEYHQWPIENLISYLEGHNFHLTCLDRDSATLWVNKSQVTDLKHEQ